MAMPGNNLSRAELLAAARRFCDSFARKDSVEEILSHFSAPPSSLEEKFAAGVGVGAGAAVANDDGSGVLVREHGLPRLAPFLGRDFRGLDGAREYFDTVAACLDYEDMRFLEFVADESGKVAVRGEAAFTWRETGQRWEETFVYLLLLDAVGKVRRYEVWADSGAAYLARRGELGG